MQQRDFLNAMRILTSIDRDEVPFLDGPRWHAFRTDPFRFMIRADDKTADAIYGIIERRQPRTVSVAAGIDRVMGCSR
jgi:hypothetical protein